MQKKKKDKIRMRHFPNSPLNFAGTGTIKGRDAVPWIVFDHVNLSVAQHRCAVHSDINDLNKNTNNINNLLIIFTT